MKKLHHKGMGEVAGNERKKKKKEEDGEEEKIVLVEEEKEKIFKDKLFKTYRYVYNSLNKNLSRTPSRSIILLYWV